MATHDVRWQTVPNASCSDSESALLECSATALSNVEAERSRRRESMSATRRSSRASMAEPYHASNGRQASLSQWRLSVTSVCGVRALWPNDWTDQGETWHSGRPRPWPHCVRWGPRSTSHKGAQPPIFGPYLLRPNGCMNQDVTWYGGRPRPRQLCVRWRPRSPSPIFGPCLLRSNGWMDGTWLVLGMVVGLSPGEFVLDGDPAPSPERDRAPPQF